MLGEVLLLGYFGVELVRRPSLRKKAWKVAKKLPSVSMYLFEKGVSATSSYFINAWSDVCKQKNGA